MTDSRMRTDERAKRTARMPSLPNSSSQAAFLAMALAAATAVLASMPGAPAAAADSGKEPFAFGSCDPNAAPVAAGPTIPAPLTGRFATPVQPGGAKTILSIPVALPDGVERRFTALFQWRTAVGGWQPLGKEAVGQYVVSVEKDGEHATKALAP